MRCLVVADIHSNLLAFEAVLSDAGPCDEVWCLGDIVGYGPDPNECVDLLRSLPHRTVAGNHDYAAVGMVATTSFNAQAREATEWTAARLSADNREYLEQLPLRITAGGFTLVHGSIHSAIWEYVDNTRIALANLLDQPTRYCLVGHTHVPTHFREVSGLGLLRRARERRLDGNPTSFSLDSARSILNPGSIGQPRDGDPRASYMLLDPEAGSGEVRRVEYPIAVTQNRILNCGLPERNALRLKQGL